MKSDYSSLFKSRNSYQKFYGTLKSFKDDGTFLNYIGITTKQWRRFRQSGKLKVGPKTHAIIMSLSELPTASPHFRTMFIMVEIKHGKRANND